MNTYIVACWVEKRPYMGLPEQATGTYYELDVVAESAEDAKDQVRRRYKDCQIRSCGTRMPETRGITVRNHWLTVD